MTCTRATIWVLCDKFVSISAFCSSECARCQLFCRNAANGRCQSTCCLIHQHREILKAQGRTILRLWVVLRVPRYRLPAAARIRKPRVNESRQRLNVDQEAEPSSRHHSQSEPHANGTSICHRRTEIDESDIHQTVPATAREKPGKHGLARQ